jgi:hypothetical protein
MSEQKGYIKTINYGKIHSKIFDKMIFYISGDFIDDPSTYKAEIDFIKYISQEEMTENIDRITENIKIEFIQ